MGNNPQTWAIAISLLSLLVASISLIRTGQFRRDQIQLQLPLLDFWTEIERTDEERTTTVWLQNKGASAAEIIGWSIFVAGKPVDLTRNREDWLAILSQVGIDGEGGWCAVIDPGYALQAHQSLKVLELQHAITPFELEDRGQKLFDRALGLINIKCVYASPAVDFDEELYLQDPNTYSEHVRTVVSEDRRQKL